VTLLPFKVLEILARPGFAGMLADTLVTSPSGSVTVKLTFVRVSSGIRTSAMPDMGGFAGQWPLPPLNLFGGATGIQTGFTLNTVPEPTASALMIMGLAVLVEIRSTRTRRLQSQFPSGR
jgi:hypothetical protein